MTLFQEKRHLFSQKYFRKSPESKNPKIIKIRSKLIKIWAIEDFEIPYSKKNCLKSSTKCNIRWKERNRADDNCTGREIITVENHFCLKPVPKILLDANDKSQSTNPLHHRSTLYLSLSICLSFNVWLLEYMIFSSVFSTIEISQIMQQYILFLSSR